MSVSPDFTKRPTEDYRLTITFACDPARTQDLIKALFDVVDEFRTNGPSPGQVADAQAALRRDLETDTRQNGYLLNQLAYAYQYDEPVPDPATLRGLYESVDDIAAPGCGAHVSGHQSLRQGRTDAGREVGDALDAFGSRCGVSRQGCRDYRSFRRDRSGALQYFAGEGAAIAAVDRRDSLNPFADRLRGEGVRIESAVVDIGDAAAVGEAFSRFVTLLGPIDILINNAGASLRASLERTTPDTFRSDIEVNLNGAYNCAHAVLPDMKARRAGTIVNIGSVNGLSALGDAAYSAGKAGMISLTKALALEFGKYNIRANIVCPGTVRTPLWNDRAARNPRSSRNCNAGIPSAASSSRSRSCARSRFSPPTRPRRSRGSCCLSTAG